MIMEFDLPKSLFQIKTINLFYNLK